MSECEHCDTFGGVKTFKHQAVIPINGKVQCIDWCIHPIVSALNAAGIVTVASCCGHGKIEGRIDLADGRILRIEKTVDSEQLNRKAKAAADHIEGLLDSVENFPTPEAYIGDNNECK